MGICLILKYIFFITGESGDARGFVFIITGDQGPIGFEGMSGEPGTNILFKLFLLLLIAFIAM